MVEDNVIEEIKSRLDIVDVISDYADLKKAGSNFRGLCPFHSEKTPSFMVSPQKQIFHCFGCSAGGDIFGFIMRYENVPFPEAIETLARRAGVEFKKSYSRKKSKENETIYEINEDTTQFYVFQLDKNRGARNYFRKRGLDDSTIKEFRLGYALPKFDTLLKHLKDKGYSENAIEKAGLIRYSEKRKPYDMFRGRIIFPISDISGKVIAFGARILDSIKDPKAPKYINSPETPVFKKGYTLYGINVANKAIREKDYAIVAEGYTDVIVCHQYGFRHAVAPLGTALTEGHLKKIRAHTKNLLLIFDADEAGVNAARRSLRLIYEKGLKAKVLTLPDGDDPDSFLKQNGADALQHKLGSESKSLVQFYLHLKISEDERDRELKEITLSVPDLIQRGQLKNEILRATSNTDIFQEGDSRKLRKKDKRPIPKQDQSKTALPEELLLSIAFTHPEYSNDIINKINTVDIEKNILKDILLRVKEMENVPSLDNMSTVFSESEISYITSLTINTGFDQEKIKDIVDDCFTKIRQKRLNKDIKDIEHRIKTAESSGDDTVVNSLLAEKQKLLKEARDNGIL